MFFRYTVILLIGAPSPTVISMSNYTHFQSVRVEHFPGRYNELINEEKLTQFDRVQIGHPGGGF